MILLALAACADKEIVYTPQTVSIPVAVHCHVSGITAPSYPSYNLHDTMFRKTQYLIAEVQERRAYEMQLVAALNVCQQ